MTARHSARARAALEALVEEDPAIAALSLWCAHRDGAETGTRGTTITYGPDFEALPPHEQRGLAAHHVLHVALRHSARLAETGTRLGPGFDADRWNLAADALVNEAVGLAGHALPRPAVTASALLAEARQDTTPEAALAEWDVDRLYHALAGSGAEGEGARRGFAPDLAPEEGDPGTRQEDAARWRQHLARALDAGRRTGRGLGRIGHRIADIPEPRTPWELILRSLLARAVIQHPGPAPLRPARRWLASTAQAARAGTPEPGFEPGTHSRTTLPRIAVAVDASGSVDEARLALFWAEITGIARRLRAELHLMVFDDAIRHQARIDPGAAPVLPPMPRGGGTDFAPPIAEAGALGAATLVILTDLEADPGPAPRLPVIWAVPDAHGRAAPYGRLLDLSG
ncbi:vWA domain-containing protein [Jannaschia formosa]|uniref:vWA domain-containing protein n=1 Tax=Jannaschia formosa TaxID=2259592 RepID=UPI00142FC859|nr:VWA-like domain-containing protein [Jannaschia formosa]